MLSSTFRSVLSRLALVAFGLFLSISTLTRIGLCVFARHDIDPGMELARSLAWGFGFDLAAACFATLPWILAGALIPARLIRTKAGKYSLFAFLTVYSSILVFIATAEGFFWNEFGARFNFIAVDYLIWTQEVWGNINESYPMPLVIGGILGISVLLVAGLAKAGVLRWVSAGAGSSWLPRCGWAFGGLAAAFLITKFVSQSQLPACSNQYNGELAKNGPWSFFAAFRNMELD